MKIHKSYYILIIIFVLIFVSACSSNDKGAEKQDNSDTAFLKDLEKALKKRWKYAEDADSGKIQVDDDIKHMETLLSFEQNLSKYKDEDFDNPKLKKVVQDYLEGLQFQQDAIQYYNVDFTKYDEFWNKGYDVRATSLLKLVEEFGLNVDEEQFKDLKTNAQLVNQQLEIEGKIEDMIRNVTFEKVKTEYDWTTYQATIENTSGVALESFSFDINLVDKEKVIIGSEYAYHSGTWKPGEKVLFEFSTDVKGFDKMEWEAEYYIAEN